MEWLHKEVGVLPCMWNVSIPNTPHPYFQQLVFFEVLDEANNIGETCF
jgi:hypothetical protein